MKQQTPLRKAIYSISDLPMRYDTNKREFTISLDSVVSILTNLIPEERRVIEEAYAEGRDDVEYRGCGLSRNDFFTSNFEQ